MPDCEYLRKTNRNWRGLPQKKKAALKGNYSFQAALIKNAFWNRCVSTGKREIGLHF